MKLNIDDISINDTVTDVIADLKAKAGEVSNANHLLVVGGGLTGVEVAGELLAAGKEVTIVHKGQALLQSQSGHSWPDKLSKKVTAKLQSLGKEKVHILCNERVSAIEDPSSGPFSTESGTQIDAQYALMAGGVRVNDALFGSLTLGSAGGLKVDSYLRCDGQSAIFAGGDAADVPGVPKQAAAAGKRGMAPTLAANLLATALGKEGQMKAYKAPGNAAAFVTLGPNEGAALLPNGMFMGRNLPRMFKGKDFLQGDFRKEFTA